MRSGLLPFPARSGPHLAVVLPQPDPAGCRGAFPVLLPPYLPNTSVCGFALEPRSPELSSAAARPAPAGKGHHRRNQKQQREPTARPDARPSWRLRLGQRSAQRQPASISNPGPTTPKGQNHLSKRHRKAPHPLSCPRPAARGTAANMCQRAFTEPA